jgi:hypothetical protein
MDSGHKARNDEMGKIASSAQVENTLGCTPERANEGRSNQR